MEKDDKRKAGSTSRSKGQSGHRQSGNRANQQTESRSRSSAKGGFDSQSVKQDAKKTTGERNGG
jgi:hypothetical protein